MVPFNELKTGECFEFEDKIYCRVDSVREQKWNSGGMGYIVSFNCFNLTDLKMEQLSKWDGQYYFRFLVERIFVTEVNARRV